METNVEDNIHRLRLRLIDSVKFFIDFLGKFSLRKIFFRIRINNVKVPMIIQNERVSFPSFACSFFFIFNAEQKKRSFDD